MVVVAFSGEIHEQGRTAMQHQSTGRDEGCLDTMCLPAGERRAHRKAGIALGFEIAFQHADEGLDLFWAGQFAKQGKLGSGESEPFPRGTNEHVPSSSCLDESLKKVTLPCAAALVQ